MKYGLIQFNNNGTLGIWAVELINIVDGFVSFRIGTVTKYNGDGAKSFTTRGSDIHRIPVTEAVFVEGDVLDKNWIATTKNQLRNTEK